ncbi:hypothetical protein I7I50_10237 [Histoplasma capsulatum G186AR]|uniref:Uncharacterized protein n=1 Tax=Ajellomyces capsulatus TaxID=5037 RepID=A0A8H8D7B5_AJECA|nr:hypothetical protein I7I52_01476 [Histoplasma capsulatum]QSS69064.1 hypothetical protein I7I50_10237 [Histoplasma capsulatum G186AR]
MRQRNSDDDEIDTHCVHLFLHALLCAPLSTHITPSSNHQQAINQVAGGSSSTLGPISQPPAKPPSQITDMIFQQLHGRLFPSPQPWCPTSTTQQRQQPTANSQQPAANSKQAIPCPDRGAVCKCGGPPAKHNLETPSAPCRSLPFTQRLIIPRPNSAFRPPDRRFY